MHCTTHANVLRVNTRYRPSDVVDAKKRNDESFRAISAALREGKLIAIAPEGRSTFTPAMLKLKTGAARMALACMASSVEHDPEFTIHLVVCGISSVNYTLYIAVFVNYTLQDPLHCFHNGAKNRNLRCVFVASQHLHVASTFR